MTDTAKSPAQKVLAAFDDRSELCGPFELDWAALCLAAALRAAADQIKMREDPGLWGNAYWAGVTGAKTKLLAIAAELEGQP